MVFDSKLSLDVYRRVVAKVYDQTRFDHNFDIEQGEWKRARCEKLTDVPSHPFKHLRGFVVLPWAHYVECGPDEYPPLKRGAEFRGMHRIRAAKTLFHSKPTGLKTSGVGWGHPVVPVAGCSAERPAYSSIPDRFDVFQFLRHEHERLVTRGWDRGAVFEKTDRSAKVMCRLQGWLEEHPYALNRFRKRYPEESELRLRQRLADAAFRDLEKCWLEERGNWAETRVAWPEEELKWPGKLNVRRKLWPEYFRQLGLRVTVF